MVFKKISLFLRAKRYLWFVCFVLLIFNDLTLPSRAFQKVTLMLTLPGSRRKLSLFSGCNILKNHTPVFHIRLPLFRKLPSTMNVEKPFVFKQTTYKKVLISLTQSCLKDPIQFWRRHNVLSIGHSQNSLWCSVFLCKVKKQFTFYRNIAAQKQILYFWLYGQSRCLNICSLHVTKECIEFNWLCKHNPVGICLLKVNNRNTRTRCEIYSKLTIKIPEQRRNCQLRKNDQKQPRFCFNKFLYCIEVFCYNSN